jgi:hypothetical protein
MTEERFDDLINLYLDNEISRSDLGELKHAIKDNLVRRRKFEQACHVHQAARKALTSPGASQGSGPRTPSSHRSSPTPPKESRKNKQSQAHRNASVSVLAERQDRHGSASSLELGKIKIESYSDKNMDRSGASRNFSFFDSPLGMVAAILLTLIGAIGMFFVMRAASPDAEDDPGKFVESSPITRLDGGYDPKAAEELTAEIKKHKAEAAAADVMRARLYQSALTGQPASSPTSVDYFSPQVDATTASTTSDVANTDLPQLGQPATPAAPATPEATNSTAIPQL